MGPNKLGQGGNHLHTHPHQGADQRSETPERPTSLPPIGQRNPETESRRRPPQLNVSSLYTHQSGYDDFPSTRGAPHSGRPTGFPGPGSGNPFSFVASTPASETPDSDPLPPIQTSRTSIEGRPSTASDETIAVSRIIAGFEFGNNHGSHGPISHEEEDASSSQPMNTRSRSKSVSFATQGGGQPNLDRPPVVHNEIGRTQRSQSVINPRVGGSQERPTEPTNQRERRPSWIERMKNRFNGAGSPRSMMSASSSATSSPRFSDQLSLEEKLLEKKRELQKYEEEEAELAARIDQLREEIDTLEKQKTKQGSERESLDKKIEWLEVSERSYQHELTQHEETQRDLLAEEAELMEALALANKIESKEEISSVMESMKRNWFRQLQNRHRIEELNGFIQNNRKWHTEILAENQHLLRQETGDEAEEQWKEVPLL